MGPPQSSPWLFFLSAPPEPWLRWAWREWVGHLSRPLRGSAEFYWGEKVTLLPLLTWAPISHPDFSPEKPAGVLVNVARSRNLPPAGDFSSSETGASQAVFGPGRCVHL